MLRPYQVSKSAFLGLRMKDRRKVVEIAILERKEATFQQGLNDVVYTYGQIG